MYLMRNTVNPNVEEFVGVAFQLKGEDLTLVARAAELTAFYGDMLEYEQIAFAEDMPSFDVMHQKLAQIIGRLERNGTLKLLEDDWVWEKPLKPKQFLVMVAAMLISAGLQSSSLDGQEEFQFAVSELNCYFSPATVRKRRQFRGYTIMLEYLRQKLKGSGISPSKYLTMRYGKDRGYATNNGSPRDDLRQFMRLIWETAPNTGAYSLLRTHNMLEKMPTYSVLADLIAKDILEKWKMHNARKCGEYGIRISILGLN